LRCSNSLLAVNSLALEKSPEPAHKPAPVRYIVVMDISATPCIARSSAVQTGWRLTCTPLRKHAAAA
jgi:hypothetical protein